MTNHQGQSEDQAGVRVAPPVFFLPMLIGVGLHYLVFPLGFSLPEVLGGWITRVVIGVLIGLGGLGLQGLAIAQFRKTGQETGYKKPTTSIIRTGPFRYSRNPVYVGAMLIHLGVGIATGSIWALATLLIAVLMAYFLVVVPEEKYLERKFGDECHDYKASVRRWL